MPRIPVVDAERCVHSRMAAASCRACVDACPTRAWRLDDEGLNLAENACDGCGLCAAACPTEALGGITPQPASRYVAGRPALLAACERSPARLAEGRVPCLNAFSLAWLLEAWRAGQRIWVVSSEDCASCSRGRGAGLDERVDRLNALLAARGKAVIQLRRASPNRLAALLASGSESSPHPRRRAWLGLGTLPDTDIGPSAQEVVESCLTGRGPLPWSIGLDDEACVGCGACARVCPTRALEWSEPTDTGADAPVILFHLHHARCVGCGLCADVCDQGALRVNAWVEPGKDVAVFRLGRCDRCGAPLIQSGEHRDPQPHCWVCMQGTKNGRPFQRME